jgi:hypothetical protein
VPTNVSYEYVFKKYYAELDEEGNMIPYYSQGVVKRYTREGANTITGLQMRQVEKAGGYDAMVEWDRSEDAQSIRLTATNGSRTITETLPASATSYMECDGSCCQ